MSLANSVALRLAGVTAATPDPPGGVIVRDAAANPTGILKDAAQAYVFRVIPAPTREQRVRDAEAGARPHGVARRHERAGHGARPRTTWRSTTNWRRAAN